MYRCKECGAKYEEKPDYCDCGNDEFEIVGSEINLREEANTTPKTLKENIDKEKPQVRSASDANFHNINSYIPKRIIAIDPISLIIFIICIILSIYVIFFAWNSENSDKEIGKTISQTTNINKNIPSIDKIWNNAIPVEKKEAPKKEEKVENIIKQIIPVQPVKKAEVPKKVQTTTQGKNITKVPLTKNTTTSKKASATTKSSTNTTKQQKTINVQEQAKKAEEAAAKQKAEQERKAAEAAQLKKLQEEQAKKAAEEKARQSAAAKQELISYKAQLRNTIGKKIDFTRVIGDGSCTVTFKIDSNGKLINRSFAKQSSNNTLNDAVYAAVMATPTFNPPPSAYNNEFLNLYIRFSNGNFEISLP